MSRFLSFRRTRWSLAAWGAVLAAAVFAPLPASAATNATNARVNGAQTFYTWVQEGESYDAIFTKAGRIFSGSDAPVELTFTRPDGTSTVCTDITVTAPNGTACSLSETAPVTGVYSVRLASTDASASYVNATMNWSITTAANGTAVPGRTWSELYRMRNENTAFVPGFDLWYLTEHGYTYRMNVAGRFHGINSAFGANAFGIIDTDTCASAYTSAAFTENQRPNIVAAYNQDACDYNAYKIFFEEPATDLPLTVTLPDGTSTWMARTPATPTITGLTFTPTTTGARSGTVELTVGDYEGNALVQVDADGDGAFDGERDLQYTVAVVNGAASLDVPGIDALGSPIPTTQAIGFRAALDRVGEVHFVLDDIELLEGGISVTRLNGPAQDRTRLFWDDTALTTPEYDMQYAIKCSTTPALSSGPDGTDSTGGVHGWGFGDCADVNALNSAPTDTVNGGSWGNNRILDNWAYVDADVDRVIVVDAVPEPTPEPTEPTPEPTTPTAETVPTTPVPTLGASTTAASTGALPRTGADTGLWITAAVGLATFIAGTLLLLARRRHHTDQG